MITDIKFWPACLWPLKAPADEHTCPPCTHTPHPAHTCSYITQKRKTVK